MIEQQSHTITMQDGTIVSVIVVNDGNMTTSILTVGGTDIEIITGNEVNYVGSRPKKKN